MLGSTVRRISLTGLAVLASLVAPARAAEPSTALAAKAVATIVAAAEGETAAISACRAVDPANNDIYDALALRLHDLYKPYYERAGQILPTAGRDAGYPDGDEYSREALATLHRVAEDQIAHLFATKPRAQVIATCRELLVDGRQQKGPFAAPVELFPTELRIIESWRQPP
jgi:hypothetical protein